jgi:outer membrane protein
MRPPCPTSLAGLTGKKTMNRALLTLGLLGAVALGGTASAQGLPWDAAPPVGKQAGTFMIRIGAMGVIPLTSSSSISVIGGSVGATAQAAPELKLAYFFTDNIALEVIAGTTRHYVTANNTAVGDVDVGDTWVLPPTLTLQYHFLPHERFSPYLGAGINYTIPYAWHSGSAAIQSLSYSSNVGAAVQAGVDYNFSGHWFANFDVMQIFVNTTAKLGLVGGTEIKASTALNPLVVSASIGYRF